jgi:hypothetical protein
MPAGWFGPEVQPLLHSLVRHISTSIVVGRKILQVQKTEDWALLNTLSEIHARESKAIAELSTKLRLAPDARYSPERVKTMKGQAATPNRPWAAH